MSTCLCMLRFLGNLCSFASLNWVLCIFFLCFYTLVPSVRTGTESKSKLFGFEFSQNRYIIWEPNLLKNQNTDRSIRPNADDDEKERKRHVIHLARQNQPGSLSCLVACVSNARPFWPGPGGQNTRQRPPDTRGGPGPSRPGPCPCRPLELTYNG